MRRALTGLAVLLGLVAIACGSNSSSTTTTTKAAAAATTAAGGGGATTTTKGTASSAATTTSGSSGSETSTSFSGQGSAAYCDLARQVDKIGKSSSDTPADLKAVIEATKPLLDQVLAIAPPEIKADYEVLIPGLRKLIAALEAAGYDFSKLDPNQVSEFDTPAFTAASDHIDAYNQQVCGIQS